MLDAAASEFVARGWDGLRLTAVADQAGVSRQTLYNTFAGKRGLAQALVLRLTEEFLDGVGNAMTDQTSLHDRWSAAVRYTLDAAAGDPLVKALLVPGAGESLSLVTTDAEPLVSAARVHLTALFADTHPELDESDVAIAAESATRLAISHVVLPLHPSDEVADHVAELVVGFLLRRRSVDSTDHSCERRRG